MLIKTRNSSFIREHEFVKDYTYLAPDGAEYLVSLGVKLVGVDYLSVEQFHSGHHRTHRTLLENGVIIVEGLDLSGPPMGPYDLRVLPVAPRRARRRAGARGARRMTSPIELVLFDIGGVLGSNGWDREQRAAAVEQFDLDADDFQYRHEETAGALESGRSRSTNTSTSPCSARAALLARRVQGVHVRAERAVAGQHRRRARARRAGHRPHGDAQQRERRAERVSDRRISVLRDIFPTFFTSCWLGVRKPTLAIYERVLGMTQADPAAHAVRRRPPAESHAGRGTGRPDDSFRECRAARTRICGVHGLLELTRDAVPTIADVARVTPCYSTPNREPDMQLAMIGLGRMGGNMVERLMRDGHTARRVRSQRRRDGEVREARRHAARRISRSGRRRSPAPRVIWIMVPAGDPVDQTIATLKPLLSPGDIIIDGGNSNFHDTIRRGEELGDVEDRVRRLPARAAASGGSRTATASWSAAATRRSKQCEPIFTALAPEDGYAHVGPTGSGHYVKMVHNGIEYGMLQAYAEGYEILHASKIFPKLDLKQIAEVWQHGSVVRSWLNELAASAFAHDASLVRHQGLRRRFRRRALDGAGGDRPRRAGAGHHAVAADALPLAAERIVRREGHRRACATSSAATR